MPLEEAFYSLKLHLTHGFIWDREVMGEISFHTIHPTGWGDEFDDDV